MRARPAFVLLLPLLLSGADLETTMGRVDQAATGFKSMSAQVRRVSHTAVINEDNVDLGRMLLKRSRPRDIRMFIELTEPDQKSVALQDRKLEIYYPKIKTVQEYDVGKNRELMDQFFLLGFGTPRKELEANYSIRLIGPETIAGQQTTRLELTPKSQEVLQHLLKFELWVADASGYPAQQKFHLPGGDYMLVTYSDVKSNVNLPDSALKLQLSKDVKREYPQK